LIICSGISRKNPFHRHEDRDETADKKEAEQQRVLHNETLKATKVMIDYLNVRVSM
jgi:hypothetical protein